jgi:murein DD-endopeptidase MepM/ murein hydrolase activator NlpD/tetratricopeptide (TPR) repeat protein
MAVEEQPEKLDAKTDHEWRELATQVISIRPGENYSSSNVSLLAAADREPQAPTAPAFRLWMADNLAMDGNYSEAVKAYDHCVLATQSARPITAGIDLIEGALMHKAQATCLSGDSHGAISVYRDLINSRPINKIAPLDAGMIAERLGDHTTAVEFYKSIASLESAKRTDDPAQLARRAMERLNAGDVNYSRSATALADQLTTALERRDTRTLRSLVSTTHFAIGPVGGHTGFESLELLDEFLKELLLGEVRVKRQLLGTGGKRYLPSTGWKGKWFQGDVSLIVTEAPGGWQWTGIALFNGNKHWAERWKPAVIQTNDPLPFELHAPWPKDQCFTAGGLWEHVAEAVTVAAAWPFSAIVAAGFAAASCCGWGPRGFYYNSGPTHSDEDAFAIDFTRYRRFVPYDNESGGTSVLAVREGIVSNVRAGYPSGNPTMDNRVEVEHSDPDNPTDLTRFTSKYLHLEGPFQIPIRLAMPIRLGTRLGFMDDTGNSVLDHLHFSIHDRQLTHPDAPAGRSVRPTPMSGVTLGDSDSNKCVESTNIEYTGRNQMIFPKEYAGQNWLITPAALATNESPPASVTDQKWLLVLSGVAIIDLKGNSSQWLRETVRINPNLIPPLIHAITHHNIPTPMVSYTPRFQVEQWVPHSAPSSMFNRKHSVNSGFAVDVWRPHSFNTDTDAVTNAPIGNIFNGIQVDVAVSDIDAFLYRLSYHVTLLGKIKFGKPIIVD